jgi:metal-dependent amidase/aminoacylase/carboxypeptidase family protein
MGRRGSDRHRIELATRIAEGNGATAEVEFGLGYPVTVNDAELTSRTLPTLRRVAGNEQVSVARLQTPAEDFSYYQQKIPGLFLFLGIVPLGQNPAAAPANRSPFFTVDESALPVGTRALTALAVDYLSDRVR